EAARHSRKLQRGALKDNRFRIVLREVEGDQEAAARTVESIRTHGVPNYFGAQRFGREAGNVVKALAMFAGKRVQRHERSLLLSAARSHLFNAVLAARVEQGNWNRPLDGEVWMLDGSHSIFGPEPLTTELRARHAGGDIAPTGPMWGAGELRTREMVAELENSAAARYPELAAGLAAAGLRQERRSLVLHPRELELRWLADAGAELSFCLNSGAYATVLLREIVDYSGRA
ncbi:MAG: tRNA pseudouridine(13) synthase TruD, partial [Proteobacteria bacterium]|nr:tRNA pseudouridine(13) synthase TruD [Pseudomonadota bacterium]